jgi:hypothetical protein
MGKRRVTSDEEREIKAIRASLDNGVQHVCALITSARRTVDRVCVVISARLFLLLDLVTPSMIFIIITITNR